jgi:hypothetical protein
MKSIAMFVFNGDPMCFVHVLINGLDLNAKGHEVKIIIEGAATRLIPDLDKTDHFLNPLWEKVKQAALVEGACKACSQKMKTLEDAEKQGLALLDDVSGHPGMGRYMDAGYEIITF